MIHCTYIKWRRCPLVKTKLWLWYFNENIGMVPICAVLVSNRFWDGEYHVWAIFKCQSELLNFEPLTLHRFFERFFDVLVDELFQKFTNESQDQKHTPWFFVKFRLSYCGGGAYLEQPAIFLKKSCNT